MAWRVDAAGAILPAPAGAGVHAAIGLVLGAVHEARADGTWPRLKACPGRHCGWAFYDHSRNGGSTWCSMRVCGGREKARAYRRRSC
jgi:predicted RNA-binding Zn ribbon-like protein